MEQQSPEVLHEERIKMESVFMRTVIRKDIYERLRKIAQQYSTGQGYWDFGVAIQILLDYYDNGTSASQSDKLDFIIGMLSPKPVQEEVPKEEFLELLGGEKIKKGEI